MQLVTFMIKEGRFEDSLKPPLDTMFVSFQTYSSFVRNAHAFVWLPLNKDGLNSLFTEIHKLEKNAYKWQSELF